MSQRTLSQRTLSRSGGTPAWGVAAWAACALVPLGFLVVFFAWPVFALISTGFVAEGKNGAALDFTGFTDVFAASRTWQVIGQTLLQATLATLASVALGLPLAYVIGKLDFPGRTALQGFLAVPFVLPTVVVGVAFTAIIGPGGPLGFLVLEHNLGVVIAAMAFFNVTVVARMVASFWGRLDDTARRAAQVLGASRARAWLTMTLPALMPALAPAAALVFLFSSTSFGIVLILGGREFANLETEIYRQTVQFLDLRGAAVLSIAQLVIVGLTLFVSQRLTKQSERAVTLRPDQQFRARPRLHDLPVIAFAFVTVTVLHFVPILTLVTRSFRGAATSEGAERWTLANYVTLFDPASDLPIDGTGLSGIMMSLRLAAVAAVLALVLGTLIAFVLSRKPRSKALQRGIRAFDAFVMLPLGVSAVTLGFGLLITMHRPLGIGFDLRTSVVLIPIAQALVALPLVVRMLVPVLRALDERLRFAAASLGASPFVVLRTIELPMLGRSAGLALGFAFAASLGEFGATSFLVRPGEQTLPVMIASLIGHPAPGTYGAGLAGAVTLGALTATVLLLAERFRTDNQGAAVGIA